LCSTSSIEARPRLFRDFDAGPRNRRMIAQDPIAKREAERFNLCRAMFACGAVHQILECFAGRQSVGLAVAKRRCEVSFEAERDTEFLGIVAIAPASEPKHPEARFAMTAGANAMHDGALYHGGNDRGPGSGVRDPAIHANSLATYNERL
jgi:hypothetical protein